MAKKVTDADIELINELYLELGVKARVAEKTDFSASTVSKYIIKGYVSKRDRVEVTFDITKITGPDKNLMSWQGLADSCKLSDEEWAELKEMQKEIMI